MENRCLTGLVPQARQRWPKLPVREATTIDEYMPFPFKLWVSWQSQGWRPAAMNNVRKCKYCGEPIVFAVNARCVMEPRNFPSGTRHDCQARPYVAA